MTYTTQDMLNIIATQSNPIKQHLYTQAQTHLKEARSMYIGFASIDLLGNLNNVEDFILKEYKIKLTTPMTPELLSIINAVPGDFWSLKAITRNINYIADKTLTNELVSQKGLSNEIASMTSEQYAFINMMIMSSHFHSSDQNPKFIAFIKRTLTVDLLREMIELYETSTPNFRLWDLMFFENLINYIVLKREGVDIESMGVLLHFNNLITITQQILGLRESAYARTKSYENVLHHANLWELYKDNNTGYANSKMLHLVNLIFNDTDRETLESVTSDLKHLSSKELKKA